MLIFTSTDSSGWVGLVGLGLLDFDQGLVAPHSGSAGVFNIVYSVWSLAGPSRTVCRHCRPAGLQMIKQEPCRPASAFD